MGVSEAAVCGGEAKAECGGARGVTIAMRGSERQLEAGEGAVGTQSQSKGHVGPEDANRSRGAGNREAAFLRTRGERGGGE